MDAVTVAPNRTSPLLNQEPGTCEFSSHGVSASLAFAADLASTTRSRAWAVLSLGDSLESRSCAAVIRLIRS
jgi:hypothetical protein